MKAVCVHWWHIDRNDYGRCCLCGKEKDFAALQAKIGGVNPYKASRVKHHKGKVLAKRQSNVLPEWMKKKRGRPLGAVSSLR